MKRQSAAYPSDVTFSTCFQHLQSDTYSPSKSLSLVKSKEIQNRERFLVQADNVGTRIDFRSCVLPLLSFLQFFSVAFFLFLFA
jgi:hypothetical protein